MIESFLIALTSLLIALYLQARKAAREIRRNREAPQSTARQPLILRSQR